MEFKVNSRGHEKKDVQIFKKIKKQNKKLNDLITRIPTVERFFFTIFWKKRSNGANYYKVFS